MASWQARRVRRIVVGLPTSLLEVSDDDRTMQEVFDDEPMPLPVSIHASFTMEQANINAVMVDE